jgi:hypothetical protein
MIEKSNPFSAHSEDSSNWEFQSIHKNEDFSAIEELSAIPNIKELQEIKDTTTELNTKLIEKINGLKCLDKLLTKDELEFLTSMKDFIVTKEKDQPEICIDIQYLDSIRKQQQLIIRILQEISNLQWKVEKRYEEIKDNERNKERKRECNKECIIENVKNRTVCDCLMF